MIAEPGILPRNAGEGDHPKGSGGGCRRFTLAAERIPAYLHSIGVAAAPSTAFGGPPTPRCGGGCARP